MDISELSTSEYAPYFQPMIDLVEDGNLWDLLDDQKHQFEQFFGTMSDQTASAIHPPYTWSVKQVLAHVIDTEKIFGCRAHRIACGDETALPGFDQNLLIASYDYNSTLIHDLLEEFVALRTTNLVFFRRLNREAWGRSGICDNKPISVRAIAFLLFGHAKHHLKILQQRLA